METDNAPRSWRYPAHPRTVLILLQDGSLHKKQVVLPKSRPVLGMPVVFWGCVPSPGFTKSIQDPQGRAAQGRGVLLPFPPGTLNPEGLASSRAVLQLSKAPGRVLSVIITIMINYY